MEQRQQAEECGEPADGGRGPMRAPNGFTLLPWLLLGMGACSNIRLCFGTGARRQFQNTAQPGF